MKSRKDNPTIQIRIKVSSRVNRYVIFVKNEEDEIVIDYSLVVIVGLMMIMIFPIMHRFLLRNMNLISICRKKKRICL